MATGTIFLPVAAATTPDGSTGNAAPRVSTYVGSSVAPTATGLAAYFNQATANHLWWTLTCPANYASGGTFRLLWACTAITGNVVWGARVNAVTAGDVDTYLEHATAAATTTTTAVNATEASRVVETTIAPSVDSMAANDLVRFLVYRDAANAADTVNSNEAVLLSAVFEFTTT